MFALQIKEKRDQDWTTIRRSRPEDTPHDAILRLVVAWENIKKMEVFEDGVRHRIVPEEEKDFKNSA